MVEVSDVVIASSNTPIEPVNVIFCTNCDDEQTLALFHCSLCQTNLCGTCDGPLHKSQSKRLHLREAIVVNDGQELVLERTETTTRAKLSGLLITVDFKMLKAAMEFRPSSTVVACRFCSVSLGAESGVGTFLATGIQGSCEQPDCVSLAKNLCTKTHSCGHACNGVRDEVLCLCASACARAHVCVCVRERVCVCRACARAHFQTHSTPPSSSCSPSSSSTFCPNLRPLLVSLQT